MKIFGVPLWGVISGTVAFYFVGFLWYGVFFTDIWMAGHSYTEEMAEGMSPMPWMAIAIVQTFIQVIGVGLVLKWRGWPDIAGAVQTALTIGICFAAMFAGYHYLYGLQHSFALFLVDASHIMIGWVLSAIAITLLR